MSTALPEDDEVLAPRNAQSRVAAAPRRRSRAKTAAAPPVQTAAPPVQTVARFRVILEEDPGIPPTGLFISANGKPYMLMAGVEAQVPQEVLSILNDAVISVPIIDPQSQRVTGYRSRLRFPYRRIDR
jgi:hypothetical protein